MELGVFPLCQSRISGFFSASSSRKHLCAGEMALEKSFCLEDMSSLAYFSASNDAMASSAAATATAAAAAGRCSCAGSTSSPLSRIVLIMSFSAF